MEPILDRVETLRAGLIALTVTMTVGLLVNDTGVAIPPVTLTLVLPLLIAHPTHLAYVYFGQGFYGLLAAAHGCFGVMLARLTWAKASVQAGLAQASSACDPADYLSAKRLRQRHVLDRLVAPATCFPHHRPTRPSRHVWVCDDHVRAWDDIGREEQLAGPGVGEPSSGMGCCGHVLSASDVALATSYRRPAYPGGTFRLSGLSTGRAGQGPAG